MPASGSTLHSDRAVALIDDLLAASTETANVEFKENNPAPQLWETGIAASFLSEDEALARIDYPSYFDLTDQPLPNDRSGIVERLSHDQIIAPDVGGRWNVTHLGAILFAKRLDQFDSSIARKAVRFTSYDGPSRGGHGDPPVR